MVTLKLRRAKIDYYFNKFDSIRDNSKDTWKLINTILGRKKSKFNDDQSFSYNDTVINDPIEIAEKFNRIKVQDRSLIWNTDLIETLELQNLLANASGMLNSVPCSLLDLYISFVLCIVILSFY